MRSTADKPNASASLWIKRIILSLVLAAAAGVSIYGFVWAISGYRAELKAYDVAPLAASDLDAEALEKCDKLMIVAHPDDELIWGGGHLMEGGYLVLCITNGRNQRRSEEFKTVVTRSGNVPLILEYPDKVGGERDDWNNVREQIEADISFVMQKRSWQLVVTHNEKGEYGHIHHKMTSALTTSAYDSLGLECPLYYFGKYYKAVDLPAAESGLTKISPESYAFKVELSKIYSSQDDVFKKLWHMMSYEEWTLREK